ncbi:MAG TPA: carboxypeptidase-like regulatory domain-containing protein [Chitinophagaceae bacterium]|nr:carboxypeptidase-like regulatory domain-containing protein [Chitinophagaceae bacterium]
MANDRTIRTYTAADIEKYQQGLLSAAERHALEKAALDDPFLADALEGYAVAGVNAKSDSADLEKRLSDRISEKKVIPLTGGKSGFPWLRAAAMIILLAGAGLLVYQLGFNKKINESEIAQSPAKTEVKSPDTINADVQNNQAGLLNKADSTVSSASVSPGVGTQTITQNNSYTTRDNNTRAGNTVPLPQFDTVLARPSAINELATDKPASAELKKQNDEKDLIASRKLPVTKMVTPSQPIAKERENEVAGVKQADEENYKKAAERSQKEGYYLKTANIFRGRVTDLQNNAVPFANVTNREDNVGTYTDAKGYFNLTSPDSVLNVQVRSLGYNDNNARLYNNVRNNQVLMQEDRSLNEVVISQKKPNASSRARTNNMKLENENEPEPEDGWDNYDSYLANNLNIPEDFKKIKQTGIDSVRLSFEVNKYGMPVNIKVLKSLCERCDQEAIRLVKEGPRWKRKKGRTTVTVSF